MRRETNLIIFLSMFFVILFGTSCEKFVTENRSIVDSLDPVEEVIPINGGDNVTITMNKNEENAYFTIELSNIKQNNIIGNGTQEGWCIDWTKPIDTNHSTYDGIKLYSTFRVEKWKPLNYLLNIADDLKEADPDLSWREIQVAIWSLRGNPTFNLDEVAVDDLPGDMQSNGQPNFSYDKVNEILKKVEEEYKKFTFSEGTEFAVVLETPPETQTIIVVVE